MTTIAWDGRDMAADTQMNDGGLRIGMRKLRRLKNGSLVGGCGDVYAMEIFADWIDEAADSEAPVMDVDDDPGFSAMVVLAGSAEITCYDKRCHPVTIFEPHYAIGTGAAIAMTVMDRGGSAIEAVRAAIKRDAGSGGRIQVLSLNGRQNWLVPA